MTQQKPHALTPEIIIPRFVALVVGSYWLWSSSESPVSVPAFVDSIHPAIMPLVGIGALLGGLFIEKSSGVYPIRGVLLGAIPQYAYMVFAIMWWFHTQTTERPIGAAGFMVHLWISAFIGLCIWILDYRANEQLAVLEALSSDRTS